MNIETKKLREQIQRMMEDHKQERENIENEAWVEIDQMKESNKEALAEIIDQGMKSKADLTVITNNHKERKSKVE